MKKKINRLHKNWTLQELFVCKIKLHDSVKKIVFFISQWKLWFSHDSGEKNIRQLNKITCNL